MKLSAYATKTEIIQETLRQRILSGTLAPGQRLVLRALGEEFACSDIPVREAMRTLAAERLVTITPHEGARVTSYDAGELVHLTQTRSLLEPEATVLGGANITAEAMEQLKALLVQMHAIADGKSSADYGRLNREFHRAILNHCPNRVLASLIEDLWGRAERGRAVHRLLDGHLRTSIEQHEEIVRCISAGDLDALRTVSERHCAHGLAAVRRLSAEDMPARPVTTQSA